MTNLSPAAASIVQAFHDCYEIGMFNDNWREDCLAAALRALAVRINGAVRSSQSCKEKLQCSRKIQPAL